METKICRFFVPSLSQYCFLYIYIYCVMYFFSLYDDEINLPTYLPSYAVSGLFWVLSDSHIFLGGGGSF